MEIGPKKFLGFSLLLAGLALCGVGLWLLLSPAQYQATARIEINPDGTFFNGNAEDVSYDPYFIQTEFEIMQSQIVLGKVVNMLDLNVEWGRKYAGGGTTTTNESIAILKRHLNLTIERNTKLIEISFTSDDPDETAKVANAIAKAYRDYRVQRRNEQTQKGFQMLTDGYRAEEQLIKTNREKLEQLRKELNVPNPEPTDESLKSNYPSYFVAKRVLQNNNEFRKLLQVKIASELGSGLPMKPLVEIIDAAQPPKSPAGPNRFLGAALLAIGLFPTAGGFLLLKSSRHHPCPAS